jgi:hypothetical protein
MLIACVIVYVIYVLMLTWYGQEHGMPPTIHYLHGNIIGGGVTRNLLDLLSNISNHLECANENGDFLREIMSNEGF